MDDVAIDLACKRARVRCPFFARADWAQWRRNFSPSIASSATLNEKLVFFEPFVKELNIWSDRRSAYPRVRLFNLVWHIHAPAIRAYRKPKRPRSSRAKFGFTAA